jgi:DNA-binding NarL/FixJ family response regulator
MEKIKVYLVDDHDIVRDGIKSMFLFDDEIEICGDASSGDELFEVINVVKPNIAILDLSMPTTPGTVVAQKLKDNYPEIKVIILTGVLNQKDIFNCIDIEVDAFILKNSTKDILKKAILTVANGNQFFDSSISQTIIREYLNQRLLKRKSEKTLTSREISILKELTRGLSHKEIASVLFISKRTVDAHISNIMEKTKCKSKADLIVYSIKNGIADLY